MDTKDKLLNIIQDIIDKKSDLIKHDVELMEDHKIYIEQYKDHIDQELKKITELENMKLWIMQYDHMEKT